MFSPASFFSLWKHGGILCTGVIGCLETAADVLYCSCTKGVSEQMLLSSIRMYSKWGTESVLL